MGVVAACAGCGQEPPATAKPATKTVQPAAARAASEPASAGFASVNDALAEFVRLDRSTDESERAKLVAIQNWLVAQGERIRPELTAMLADPQAELTLRMTACRVLARLGPEGAPALLEAARGEPRELRVKAIESLGRIKPSTEQIVERLAALLDSSDAKERKATLRALAAIGPPANAAVPKLTAILNSTEEDETIRGLAKAALKSVDPRRGLIDVK
jgi:HEAT repeat protein